MNLAAQSIGHDHGAHCRLCLETLEEGGDQIDITENVRKAILEVFPPELVDFQSISMVICEQCLESVNAFSSFRSIIVDKHNRHLQVRMACDPLNIVVIKTEFVEAPGFTDEVEVIAPSTCANVAPRRSKRSVAVMTDNRASLLKSLASQNENPNISERIRCSQSPLLTSAEELKTGKSSSKLKALIDASEIMTCEICGRSVKRSSYFSHKQSHSTTRRWCDLCGKTFCIKRNLQVHLQSHIPKEFRLHFHCKICKNRFCTSHGLAKHMKIQHLKVETKSFDCHCGKSFMTQPGLRNHVQTVHDLIDTRRKICKVCGKLVSSLKLHTQTVHWNAPRDLMCSDCGKLFGSQHALKQHLKIHQKDYLEKTVGCNYAGCDKTYRNESYLRLHQKIAHLNQKDFKCSHEGCSKEFYTAPKLKVHIELKHKNLRQNCPIDGCSFHVGRRDYMRNHLKKHMELTDREMNRALEIVKSMKLVC